MELIKGNVELENLNYKLNDPEFLKEYKDKYDRVRIAWLPKILGLWLVFCGNLVYGRKPSTLKFRSVEIIARVPYYSWVSASFTLMTMFFANEKKALKYADVTDMAHFAQENETMHVVVISHLAQQEKKRAGFIRFTLIPVTFSFFYFWWSYVLFLINPKYSYQLNYMFESHAFDQYDLFLKQNEAELRNRKVESKFLDWYGRTPENQYDFYLSIRNDEIIHRNNSIDEMHKV